mgnify:CR=1 FL=1
MYVMQSGVLNACVVWCYKCKCCCLLKMFVLLSGVITVCVAVWCYKCLCCCLVLSVAVKCCCYVLLSDLDGILPDCEDYLGHLLLFP